MLTTQKLGQTFVQSALYSGDLKYEHSNNGAIQIENLRVSGIQIMVWIAGHYRESVLIADKNVSIIQIIVWIADHLVFWTRLNHSNARRVRYLDPHCKCIHWLDSTLDEEPFVVPAKSVLHWISYSSKDSKKHCNCEYFVFQV